MLTKNERRVYDAIKSDYYHKVPHTVGSAKELTQMSPRSIRNALRGLWVKKQIEFLGGGLFRERLTPVGICEGVLCQT